MSKLANEVQNIVNEVEGKEVEVMAEAKVLENKVKEVEEKPYDPEGKTEFQLALEALNEAGYINPTDRKNLYFPIHYFDSFKEKYIEEVVQDNRSLNAMKRSKILTVGELIDRWDELSRLKNIGKKSVGLLKNGFMQLYYDSLETAEKKAQFLKDIVVFNSRPEGAIRKELELD